MKMDLIMENCPRVISIHDDIVIYGTSDQDHDANLIKCDPAERPSFEQQETGTEKAKSVILWS